MHRRGLDVGNVYMDEAKHSRGDAPVTLSIVVPVLNEEDAIPMLVHRLRALLESLSVDYQLLFVDDGSTDRTHEVVTEYALDDPRIGLVSFSRNFGHQAAVSAGLAFATGHVVCVMDADLQDPPELLTEMLVQWRAGYDVVYATRTVRADSWLKRTFARVFYRMLRSLSDTPIPTDAADFCLMDRRVVNVMNRLPERNRYVRGLRAWTGFRQTAVAFERPRRAAGEAKYSFARSLRLGVDGVTAFSKAPLRLSIWIGLATSMLSFVLVLLTILSKLTGGTVEGWASTIVTVLFIGGVQLLSIGILGEYLGRIYDEVKQRPSFVVADIVGSALISDDDGRTLGIVRQTGAMVADAPRARASRAGAERTDSV